MRGRFVLTALVLAMTTGVWSAQRPANPLPPLNVVLLVIDDIRWDSLGAAGNTHCPDATDRSAGKGGRALRAGARHDVDLHGQPGDAADRAVHVAARDHGLRPRDRAGRVREHVSRPCSAAPATGPGMSASTASAQPRTGDFDFLRAYEGTHWIDRPPRRARSTSPRRTPATRSTSCGHGPKDKPFALAVGFFAAHAEDNAPEQYLPQDWSAKAYEGVKMPPPLRGDPKYMAALPPFLSNEANEGRVRYHWRFDTPESYQAYMTRYYRLITEVDEAVGRIVDELQAQGVYENTLIVFIGDNGYFQADRGLADKWYPYEESVRVPLVVRDPRLPPARRGTTRDQFALNIDVAPTIVARRRAARSGRDAGPGSEPALPAGDAAGVARRVLLRAPDHHVARTASPRLRA